MSSRSVAELHKSAAHHSSKLGHEIPHWLSSLQALRVFEIFDSDCSPFGFEPLLQLPCLETIDVGVLHAEALSYVLQLAQVCSLKSLTFGHEDLDGDMINSLLGWSVILTCWMMPCVSIHWDHFNALRLKMSTRITTGIGS